MKVTDTYLAEITDFGLDGKGFSKIEDIAVFTPYTAAGDLAKIKIKKVYKGVAEADAVKIVRPASCRVVPRTEEVCSPMRKLPFPICN